MDLHSFCDVVDRIVSTDYGYEDGGSLCYNLIETGAIDMQDGVDAAARITAQHMEQQ